MLKITLEGYILVSDSDLASVKEELLNHIELTRKEEGCLVFEVTQDSENVNRFNVHEEFNNAKSFEAHQQRVRHSRWGEVSASAERYYEIKVSE